MALWNSCTICGTTRGQTQSDALFEQLRPFSLSYACTDDSLFLDTLYDFTASSSGGILSPLNLQQIKIFRPISSAYKCSLPELIKVISRYPEANFVLIDRSG
jgi:hypothetical protein